METRSPEPDGARGDGRTGRRGEKGLDLRNMPVSNEADRRQCQAGDPDNFYYGMCSTAYR